MYTLSIARQFEKRNFAFVFYTVLYVNLAGAVDEMNHKAEFMEMSYRLRRLKILGDVVCGMMRK